MDRPLRRAEQAVRQIAEGKTPRFPHTVVPEAQQLVVALRAMHERLDTRFGEMQRRQAEADALVQAMGEGVIACDASGWVTVMNPAARRMLGYQPEAPLPALPVLFRQKAAREIVAAALKGASLPDREVDLDGKTCLLGARGLPHGGAVVVLHDLTELKKLEAVRRDFVANVSHELKTPLTSIAGYAETLLGEPPEPEVTRRFLETILTNTRRMQELVDDQLDLSRIESGHWRPAVQTIETEPVLRESWQPFDAASPGSLAFQVAVEPGAESLSVDPTALRQILANLYSNACRYTPSGGGVTARVTPDAHGVLLTVRDTGSGIGSEHLSRIFERFYRADPSRSRARGGSGLGLAIVKHLTEAHGGRVWATSGLGEGTTIACWFPRDASPRLAITGSLSDRDPSVT
jgi:signal transduction histidine kinase